MAAELSVACAMNIALVDLHRRNNDVFGKRDRVLRNSPRNRFGPGGKVCNLIVEIVVLFRHEVHFFGQFSHAFGKNAAAFDLVHDYHPLAQDIAVLASVGYGDFARREAAVTERDAVRVDKARSATVLRIAQRDRRGHYRSAVKRNQPADGPREDERRVLPTHHLRQMDSVYDDPDHAGKQLRDMPPFLMGVYVANTRLTVFLLKKISSTVTPLPSANFRAAMLHSRPCRSAPLGAWGRALLRDPVGATARHRPRCRFVLGLPTP